MEESEEMSSHRWSREVVKNKVNLLSSMDYSWERLKITHNPLANLRKAAVLVPLTIIAEDLYVWLTLRAQHLTKDPGKAFGDKPFCVA